MSKVDKSSEGYGIGASIMSKGDSKPMPPVSPKAPKPNNTLPFHRLTVEPANNGVTVSHMPVDSKHGGGDYGKEAKHVFDDMGKAHAHIGKVLGLGGGN